MKSREWSAFRRSSLLLTGNPVAVAPETTLRRPPTTSRCSGRPGVGKAASAASMTWVSGEARMTVAVLSASCHCLAARFPFCVRCWSLDQEGKNTLFCPSDEEFHTGVVYRVSQIFLAPFEIPP